ncbi:MAG: hypothetical protein FWG11_06040, partial [Promicromonosporaceae bacterium]|nr:hypothetical protein [Promicromonosporaceae bacterium]
AGLRGASGAITAREDHRTNSAIDTTPGWVLRQPNGTVARTEFSASTGGWSAGGVFNAVVDAGDAIVDNPNHSWTTTLTNRQIQDALGVGPVTSIEVTRRNGLGADGGRVTEMVVRSGNSARTLTGQQFRMAVGSTVLRSDWFVLGNATPPPPPVAPEVFVFGTLRAGHADTSFRFGRATDEFLAGNWWGDGDRLAVRRGNQFHFRRSLAAGPADLVVSFGRPYDDLFVGDWNGDGRDTLAVRRGNTFFVSNSLHSTTAETSFAFGRPGDEVIVGDWDGNGSDTFAVRRGNQIFLMNTLRGGTADQTFTFGRPGDALLAGNFNGRGGDTFAVRRGITMFVNNDLRGGVADHTFDLGRGGDSVLVGDWNNNGWDTFALVRR